MRSLFAAGLLGQFLPAVSDQGLERFVLEGPELHESLITRPLQDLSSRHVPRELVHANPHLSYDPEFVSAIARSGSHGRLDALGIVAALYAHYDGEKELGFYGLQAESVALAQRREKALREIWSHNISIDRAQVHRYGVVVLVVWTDGVSPEAWTAVNAVVAGSLTAP